MLWWDFPSGDATPEDADRRAPSGPSMTGDWLGGCWAFPQWFWTFVVNLSSWFVSWVATLSGSGTIESLGNRFPVCFFRKIGILTYYEDLLGIWGTTQLKWRCTIMGSYRFLCSNPVTVAQLILEIDIPPFLEFQFGPCLVVLVWQLWNRSHTHTHWIK